MPSHIAGLLSILIFAVAFVLASPLSNLTSTTPELSPEAFKRAVSAPYVFTAFTSASESNLYVYTSNDGTTFSLLKGPAYTPPSGLIRDPSVILHTEYARKLFSMKFELTSSQWKVLHCMFVICSLRLS